ncbi:MAG: tRNA (adenosine(37)-N6)-threonylcarbamoyltransferase complex dimerization subunit type 1 TsaB [Pseudomonadota bacterium]|nr:tRNA (adenosine(37)-N6)-threonylcarbamoyltransferase complex dimerization subunit type 1 TsaB [Pseudomonadota bacterium]
MKLLALDTSGKTVSVALMSDDATLGEVFFAVERHHSELLLPAVEHLLRGAGLPIDAIDLFACAIGPGSFTGLRIGVGTVKGLALAMDRPVVGVSTLEALAMNAAGLADQICPVIDAKRGQVYAGHYRSDAAGRLTRLSADRLLAPEEIADRIEGDAVFLGGGAVVYREIIDARRGGRTLFAPPYLGRISAAAVGLVACRKAEHGEVAEAVQMTPVYLRREL